MSLGESRGDIHYLIASSSGNLVGISVGSDVCIAVSKGKSASEYSLPIGQLTSLYPSREIWLRDSSSSPNGRSSGILHWGGTRSGSFHCVRQRRLADRSLLPESWYHVSHRARLLFVIYELIPQMCIRSCWDVNAGMMLWNIVPVHPHGFM